MRICRKISPECSGTLSVRTESAGGAAEISGGCLVALRLRFQGKNATWRASPPTWRPPERMPAPGTAFFAFKGVREKKKGKASKGRTAASSRQGRYAGDSARAIANGERGVGSSTPAGHAEVVTPQPAASRASVQVLVKTKATQRIREGSSLWRSLGEGAAATNPD